MRCPYCDAESSRVVDSRTSNEGKVVRRRRECLSCQKRFTTKENVEETPLIVVKEDGRRETFNRDKILRGVQVACNKRPISTETINQMVDRIETTLRDRNHEEIPSQKIGRLVMENLKSIDEVAFVRFASVYRKFRAKEEFLEELRSLDAPPDASSH